MKIAPDNLNIPLKRRDFFSLWIYAGCIFVAVMEVGPRSIVEWIATIVIAAPAFWFVINGPKTLDNWASNHRYFFASWTIFAIKLLFIYLTLRVIVPFFITLIS